MASKKKVEANNSATEPERKIDVVEPGDPNNYTVIVETTHKDEFGNESKRILNLFAADATGAYSWVMGLRQLYDQPDVVSVKLIGVFRRTVLKVVDEGDK